MILRDSTTSSVFGFKNFISDNESVSNTSCIKKNLNLKVNCTNFNQVIQALKKKNSIPNYLPKKFGFIRLRHTLKFNTFFTPGSIKALRLYNLTSFTKYNSSFSLKGKYSHNKILIKQSYIVLAWIDYISNKKALRNLHDEESSEVIKLNNYKEGDLLSSKKPQTPSFFVHPKRNYKITTIKSPMAHKTFSQEQFMVGYYSMSLSFFTINKFTKDAEINNTTYYILCLLGAIPSISTNMLFLTKYTILCKVCTNQSHFSYFKM